MKNTVLAGIVVLGLIAGPLTALPGCTTAQVQQAEQDIAKVLNGAIAAANALENNPAAIQNVEAALSALAAVAPQTGTIHEAIVDAQAALNALLNNQGSVDNVKSALEKVVNLLLTSGNIVTDIAAPDSSTPLARKSHPLLHKSYKKSQ